MANPGAGSGGNGENVLGDFARRYALNSSTSLAKLAKSSRRTYSAQDRRMDVVRLQSVMRPREGGLVGDGGERVGAGC